MTLLEVPFIWGSKSRPGAAREALSVLWPCCQVQRVVSSKEGSGARSLSRRPLSLSKNPTLWTTGMKVWERVPGGIWRIALDALLAPGRQPSELSTDIRAKRWRQAGLWGRRWGEARVQGCKHRGLGVWLWALHQVWKAGLVTSSAAALVSLHRCRGTLLGCREEGWGRSVQRGQREMGPWAVTVGWGMEGS